MGLRLQDRSGRHTLGHAGWGDFCTQCAQNYAVGTRLARLAVYFGTPGIYEHGTATSHYTRITLRTRRTLQNTISNTNNDIDLISISSKIYNEYCTT